MSLAPLGPDLVVSYHERAFSRLHGCGFLLQPLFSDTHIAPTPSGSLSSQSGMNHVEAAHTHTCTYACTHTHTHTHTHTTHIYYFIRPEYTSSLSIIPVLTDSALHLSRREFLWVIHPSTHIYQAYITLFIMQYKTSITQRYNLAIALFPSSFLIPRLPVMVAHCTTKAGEKPVHEATLSITLWSSQVLRMVLNI